MAQLEITVQERAEVGGNRPRRLRSRGVIPGVLYGGGEETLALALDRNRLKKEAGPLHENQIVALRVERQGEPLTRTAIVKELQFDHITGAVLHVDFQQIALDEKLIATVPVEAVGEPIGVTRDGGILEHIIREIELRCLPGDLPEVIEVDVSELEIGDTVHVEDIRFGEGVEVLTEPDISIFTIAAPITEEEEEAEEAEAEEAAAEEAAEPAEAESGDKEEKD